MLNRLNAPPSAVPSVKELVEQCRRAAQTLHRAGDPLNSYLTVKAPSVPRRHPLPSTKSA